jgi:UDP-glucose 4-epimerase
MKLVLITGDTGYIGQHLKKMLQETRDDIEVHGLSLETGDITVPSSVNRSNINDVGFDAVVHLAALVRVGESVEKPTEYFETNVNGTINVLRHIKCSNFIFASTGAATSPDSPYGYSKRIAEQIVQEQSKKLGIDYTIFRFFNVIGSDGFDATNPDGLFYNLSRIKKTGNINIYGDDYPTKDGTCVREYVHVNDICAAIIKAIDKPSNSIEDLAYGERRTVKEIVETFLKVNKLDCKITYLPKRPGDQAECYLPSVSKYMVCNYTYEDMLKI